MTLVSINTSIHLNTPSPEKCVLLSQSSSFPDFLETNSHICVSYLGHPCSIHGHESVCSDCSSHALKYKTHWIDWFEARVGFCRLLVNTSTIHVEAAALVLLGGSLRGFTFLIEFELNLF